MSFHTQSLRAFLRYANSRDWCDIAADAIAAPRLYAYEGLPEGPSWKHVQKLIVDEQGDAHVQIRNRAMLLLFAVYGFRLGEVQRLELNDLDWERERILLRRAKLRKVHEYPLIRDVGDAIVRYLKKVRPESKHRELFLSLRRPFRPLSRGAISTMVQKRMRRLNRNLAHYGPHSLRHACATHLLSEGFSLKEIGDHLGHVSTAATRVYAKVDLPGLRKVADVNMSELIDHAEHATQTQTPIIHRGDLAGLREVASLSLGAVI